MEVDEYDADNSFVQQDDDLDKTVDGMSFASIPFQYIEKILRGLSFKSESKPSDETESLPSPSSLLIMFKDEIMHVGMSNST